MKLAAVQVKCKCGFKKLVKPSEVPSQCPTCKTHMYPERDWDKK